MIFFLFRRFFRSACLSLFRRSLSLRWASVSVPDAEVFLEEEAAVPVRLTALPDLCAEAEFPPEAALLLPEVLLRPAALPEFFPAVLPAFCFCAEEEPDRFLPELPVVFRIG